MNRRLTTALLALVAPALLLLTGCFSVESSIVVNEDGSGTQTMRLALPAELATSMGGELPTVEELQGGLMSADDVPCATIPDDRLYQIKFIKRPFELLKGLIPRLQCDTRVVGSRTQIYDRKTLKLHGK